jgi:FkbM family methyltransferase
MFAVFAPTSVVSIPDVNGDMQRKLCSAEWGAATSHGPIRIANVELPFQVAAQLAVRASADGVSDALLSASQTFEPDELAAFAALLRPQTVVLDIGANVGWWTFNFATEHEVHSFEPFPANLALQNLSKCLNPRLASRIITYPVGLYEQEPARCEMYSSPGNVGDTQIVCGTLDELVSKRTGMKNNNLPRGSVEMRVLDNLVPPRLFHADTIIKMDIEGSELTALKGATHLLTSGVPPRAIFMEVTFFRGKARRELYQFLDQYGYAPRQRVGYNMLFVHRKRLHIMKPSPRDAHGAERAVCDDFCAFHRPPACNTTCGLKGRRSCCGCKTMRLLVGAARPGEP